MNNSERGAAVRKCSRCGSEQVIGPLLSNAYVSIRLFGHTARLRYFVCGACGHAEAEVDDKGLENIRAAVKNRDATKIQSSRRCKRCGAEIKESYSFCSTCGEPV